ncbi:hypothetical protein BGZ51_008511 [Haplosporangium sp. Z 767]|nr:hypothetical protein BGZ51_008511 [Haplosporangium sp. Z 767]KAF9184334.1 hypothetical protein BGZ50_003758 [Haplosporangium sp. Z 11]
MWYMSIFCWLNAQIPQILENFKLGSAGSSDVSQEHKADVILFGQWIYYSRQEHWKHSLPNIHVPGMPEIVETDHHHHTPRHRSRHPSRSRHHSRHPSRSRRHSRRGTGTGVVIDTPADVGEEMDRIVAVENSGADADIDLEQAGNLSPLLPRTRSRRATTASDIAHRRSTSIVLFGLMVLTMRQTLPGQDTATTTASLFNQNSGSADMTKMVGRVFARALEEEQGDPSSEPHIVQLGRIFAWVCTVFYLSSRMPQLWKNFKRKSVQGLSILMFFWAAMGNLTYTLSILNSADAVNPETRTKFLLEAVPYVLGSSGTLMFDVSIFGQWLYYTGKLRFLGLRPRLRRHHHHHSSRSRSRSRSLASRSIPRLSSMVLSTSGSQSGYNILVDDEGPDWTEDQIPHSAHPQNHQPQHPKHGTDENN